MKTKDQKVKNKGLFIQPSFFELEGLEKVKNMGYNKNNYSDCVDIFFADAQNMKKFLSFIWDLLKIVVIALAIVIPIRYFLFQPFFVKGESMEPNFENGDYLIIDEISYRFREPQRGEVIVFKYPKDPSQRFIKRIVGLPGETVEIKNGKIKISKNGQTQILDEKDYLPSYVHTLGELKLVLNDNEYFVLGDNRDFSLDSRKFGPIPIKIIIGRVLFRAWPFSDLAKFEAPAY